VFAQLRDCEHRAGHAGNLFFWRDCAREVDFVVDATGDLELFEAKWTEPPAQSDSVNPAFVRDVVGKSRVSTGAIICRAPNSYPISKSFRAMPVAELT
jgi:hypothetical protein